MNEQPSPEEIPVASHDAPIDFPNRRPSRRRFLGLSALAGLFFASPLAASATTKKTATAKKKTTTTTTKKPTTTLAPTTTKKAAAAASGAPFDETKELVVTFTFTATDSRSRNPYVAIWIEDASGTLIRTIDLSMENGRGLRYLPDLKRWYRAYQSWLSSGASDVIDTISGPTRIPGTYSASWDGRNEAGALVHQGDYAVYIEAAREHGPYEVINETVSIGTAPFSKKPADSGELQQVSIQLKARG
jgi:hypothetical protein